ncbi:L,D-transpeptidase [Pseudonocardia spinosispora]|uniref:L,D-transpeptidase n=1 Tax=Pseudonocardia spinosispora TaxID=103441 RepID=UPI00041C669A|nr:L,D-transpeptidase [Pseudonocardia spinosispora]
MSSYRRTGSPVRSRVAVVTGGVAVLTAAVGAVFAVPALAATPAEVAAATSAPVAGTPCTAAASACVDVNKRKAWLIKAGKVVRGPVTIATGGKGEETPTGDVFRVYRKDKAHTTAEFKLPNGKPAPMPDSVFFEDGGIAFHAGDPKRASAGCVHLGLTDAEAFYNFLQIGDHVQVKDGPVAAPGPGAASASKSDKHDDGDNDDDDSGDDGDSHHHHGDDDDDD